MLDLHPQPSQEARDGLRHLGCKLEEAETQAGRRRLMRFWVKWSLSASVHDEIAKDFTATKKDILKNLRVLNPQAIFK